MRKRLIASLLSLFIAISLVAGGSYAETASHTARTKKAAVKKKSSKTITKKSSKKKGKRKPKKLRRVKPLPPQPPSRVTELKYWSNPDYTRIVVSLDREVEVEHDQLPPEPEASLPPRIYIDLSNARLASGVKDISIGDGLLKKARIGQFQQNVVRVVLDVENIKDYSIFPLEDPYRVIIDVKGERRAEISKLEPTVQALPPSTSEVKVPEPEKQKETKIAPPKIRRIVVDAGHGGKDSGALGHNGSMEKDVVLSMALKLAKKLREDLQLDVVMTRSTDVFIPLEERTAIANKVNADLFVSIHANASLNKASEGIETYYLNLAKTDKAAQVAARENNTSLEKVSMLQAILFDLMANYKINDSAHLADEVQKALYKKISRGHKDAKNNGVKQGPFYVLVGATMPSILVETAFISNEEEEKRLTNASYQDETASGIFDGIKAYIESVK